MYCNDVRRNLVHYVLVSVLLVEPSIEITNHVFQFKTPGPVRRQLVRTVASVTTWTPIPFAIAHKTSPATAVKQVRQKTHSYKQEN